MLQRLCLLLVCCVLWTAPVAASADESEESWAAYFTSRESAELSQRELDDEEHADPASSMRLRISGIADADLGLDAEEALDPCKMERSGRRRAFCWTSHGRSLRIVLPALAWDVVHKLRPRTVYSYKAMDVRFPPSVRVKLPFNASTSIGYEDEVLGIRLRLRF